MPSASLMAWLSRMIFLARRALCSPPSFSTRHVEIQQEGIGAGGILQHVPNARKAIVGKMHGGEFLIQAAEQVVGQTAF